MPSELQHSAHALERDLYRISFTRPFWFQLRRNRAKVLADWMRIRQTRLREMVEECCCRQVQCAWHAGSYVWGMISRGKVKPTGMAERHGNAASFTLCHACVSRWW